VSRFRDEIGEQPRVAGRLLLAAAPAVEAIANRLRASRPNGFLIAARGSSDHAALYAKYLFGSRNRALVSLAAPALFHALPTAGMLWMLAGGAVYTVGALIFSVQWPRLIPGVFESHALWHLFVLGGSFCCFVLIVRYVAPLG